MFLHCEAAVLLETPKPLEKIKVGQKWKLGK